LVSQMVLESSNSGVMLWHESARLIPGGNGLLSKRPDRYAPDIWPTYFSKSSGVEVVDLDGNLFIDMAQMGIGTAILGYANTELTEAVVSAARKGVNCTLNAPEEVYLAERLLELNPFAGGVKFARSGGEAMAMAVRIARATSGRSKVAFSGYHGWMDWYLAANLETKNNLSQHLLPGLTPLGIPVGLAGSAIPFTYNDVDDFKKAISEHPDIGVICIEGARYDFPNIDFLSEITKIAKKNGIVVISDEITSGWRMTDGGVYKLNGFEPDIVVYAKALGGGYAISAVVGRKEVMDFAQETFISSTMWTERIGFVAALKTIDILTANKVWEHLIEIGTKIGDGWKRLADSHGIDLEITEFKPLISFKLKYGDENNQIMTLFTQEMLKRGYLAASSIYVSMAHSVDIVDRYLQSVDEVFAIIRKAIDAENVKNLLETAPRSDAFVRLTK